MQLVFDGITAISTFIGALATLVLMIIGVAQLGKFKNQVRADFAYKIYQDMLCWLDSHPEAKAWIIDGQMVKKLGANYGKWQFDDFLAYFETLWSFSKKGLIDDEIVYTLFSDYLITVYEANNFELQGILDNLRKKEGKRFYGGAELLYQKFKRIERGRG